MRAHPRVAIAAAVLSGIALLAMPVAEAATSTSNLPEVPVSQLLTSAGKLTRLHAGVTYGASSLPIAVRLTPPDGSWGGAQWKSGRLPAEQAERLHIRDEGGPPHFGWLAVGHGGTTSDALPRGVIVIMTAYARTPSVAATVDGLRTRGHGATYEPNVPVTIAGFSGIQFDGQRLPTARHLFVPFSPRSHAGGYFPSARDAFEVFGPVWCQTLPSITKMEPAGHSIATVFLPTPVAASVSSGRGFLSKCVEPGT